ncbi:MAG: response regulator [Planctomycetales bacterium]|nr:response regulator [Planctomycetales bacterium]
MPNTSTVYVVDPEPEDYQALVRSTLSRETRFEFVPSGRDALRHNAKMRPDLWIINVRLPDMSGIDLHAMLHSRTPNVPCYLIGDDYAVEDELSARQSGATMYLCKPLEEECLASPQQDHDHEQEVQVDEEE